MAESNTAPMGQELPPPEAKPYEYSSDALVYSVTEVEQIIAQRDERIRHLEHKLWCAEVNLDGAKEHVDELERELEDLRARPQAMSNEDAAKWARANKLNVPPEWDRAPASSQEAAALPNFSVSRFSDTKQRGVLVLFDRSLSDEELNAVRAALAQQGAAQAAHGGAVVAANRDAARYRWLRDNSIRQFAHPIVVEQEHIVGRGMRYTGPLTGKALDKAIDAAIAANTSPEKKNG